MRRVLILTAIMVLFSAVVFAGDEKSTESDYNFNVGIGLVDITPSEAVVLAGSPFAKKISEVDTHLFVKAMIITAGKQKLVIITLDHLKYPTDLALKARKRVESRTGIPAENVIICSSHTHSAPLWYYYKDQLVKSIEKAAELAADDLEPCRLGTAAGIVEGIAANRRVLVKGQAWNIWCLKPEERDSYPPAGPVDPQVLVLAAVSQDGKYKAIVYNYACHADVTRPTMISADFPGHV